MAGYLITNARVLDGSGTAPFAGAVRVEGNRITEVTQGATPPPARGAGVIDAGGATLMPGLVESHAHLGFADMTSQELTRLPPEEHLLAALEKRRTPYVARVRNNSVLDAMAEQLVRPRRAFHPDEGFVRVDDGAVGRDRRLGGVGQVVDRSHRLAREVQDVRGRGQSDGDFYPFAHEMDDGFESVEWAAALPGSNGRVGMYGFSYVGATQLQAAIRRPPSLRTICPALTGSQFYDGWAYKGGAFSLAFNASWAINLARDGARWARDDRGTSDLTAAFLHAPDSYGHLPLTSYPPLASTQFGNFYFDWLAHPSYDNYWRRWSIDEHYQAID